MFRWCCLAVLTVFLFVLSAPPAWSDVKLPDPQISGGKGVFDMLKHRASALGGSFPTGDISLEDLSTLLWAASGLNRPGKGWTVPMAMGREPYCKVYVTGKEGTFLYNWREHTLVETSKDDARESVGAQSFVASAPYVLIFVADGKALSGLSNGGAAKDWSQVLTGAMTQNVYLAAESLDIGVRYIASLKEDAVRTACALDVSDVPICILPAGKRK